MTDFRKMYIDQAWNDNLFREILIHLDKFELKATISDILNQSRDYYQDMDKNKVYNAEKDLLIERTNFGTTYSFALSYKF